MTAAPGKSREACTMCSGLEIAHFNKPAGPLCINCRIGGGFAICAERAEVCRDFECEWLTRRDLSRRLRLKAIPLYTVMSVLLASPANAGECVGYTGPGDACYSGQGGGFYTGPGGGFTRVRPPEALRKFKRSFRQLYKRGLRMRLEAHRSFQYAASVSTDKPTHFFLHPG
jgi:hypothetical protein